MLKDYIINNHGATINAKGNIVTLKTGYQVSRKNLGRVAVKDFTQDMVTAIIANGLNHGDYAGFWVEDGFVYCDISRRHATKKQAIAKGKELGEIAVWDWAKSRNLYCAEA